MVRTGYETPHFTFSNSILCPHNVFTCFVQFPQRTYIAPCTEWTEYFVWLRRKAFTVRYEL